MYTIDDLKNNTRIILDRNTFRQLIPLEVDTAIENLWMTRELGNDVYYIYINTDPEWQSEDDFVIDRWLRENGIDPDKVLLHDSW